MAGVKLVSHLSLSVTFGEELGARVPARHNRMSRVASTVVNLLLVTCYTVLYKHTYTYSIPATAAATIRFAYHFPCHFPDNNSFPTVGHFGCSLLSIFLFQLSTADSQLSLFAEFAIYQLAIVFSPSVNSPAICTGRDR